MDIVTQLKRDEGFSLRLYNDSVGKITIGYGRNIQDNGISADEAELMLKNDINIAITSLSHLLPWFAKLDDVRKGVLTNMVFNMGMPRMLSFHKMLTFLEDGNFESASKEMIDSKWATQVGGRAKRLATQMQTGEWQ